jgi:glycosyltransferase involved in cell wall biosynthesis
MYSAILIGVWFKECRPLVHSKQSIPMPPKIAFVSGFKEEPDYSVALFRALKLQDRGRFSLTAIAYTKRLKGFFHPFQVWRMIRKSKPDLVHLQNEINAYGGAAGILGLPVLLGLIRLAGIRAITTIHAIPSLADVRGDFSGFFLSSSAPFLSLLMKTGLSIAYRSATRLSERIIVHSSEFRERLITQYGAQPHKVTTIPHLLLKASTSKGTAPGLNAGLEGKIPVLTFGYVMRRKALEDAIEAWAQLSGRHTDAVLIVAGGFAQPSYERELKAMVKAHNLGSSVRFTGEIDADSVFLLFQKAALVLITARYSFSASGPYALSIGCEKAVLAPRLGYFEEVVQDERDGLLYEPGSIESLSGKLDRLLSDPDLRDRLSWGIKERQRQFSHSEVAYATLALYDSVLSESGRYAPATFLEQYQRRSEIGFEYEKRSGRGRFAYRLQRLLSQSSPKIVRGRPSRYLAERTSKSSRAEF